MLRGLHENGKEYRVKPELFKSFTSIPHAVFVNQVAVNCAKPHNFKYYWEQFGAKAVAYPILKNPFNPINEKPPVCE